MSVSSPNRNGVPLTFRTSTNHWSMSGMLLLFSLLFWWLFQLLLLLLLSSAVFGIVLILLQTLATLMSTHCTPVWYCSIVKCVANRSNRPLSQVSNKIISCIKLLSVFVFTSFSRSAFWCPLWDWRKEPFNFPASFWLADFISKQFLKRSSGGTIQWVNNGLSLLGLQWRPLQHPAIITLSPTPEKQQHDQQWNYKVIVIMATTHPIHFQVPSPPLPQLWHLKFYLIRRSVYCKNKVVENFLFAPVFCAASGFLHLVSRSLATSVM